MSRTRLGRILAALALLTGAGVLLAAPSRLKVREFDAAGAIDVRLDQLLGFRFRARAKRRHLSFETIRMATSLGKLPRGTFVRGRPLLDPNTGTFVVIDPDQLGPQIIRKVERKGRLDLVPLDIRYDLGATSPLSGSRRVLLDLSRKKEVTFIPDVPNLADLSDAAYEPGETYLVQVGRRAQKGKGKRNRFSFTVAGAQDPHLFMGQGAVGRPRVVNTDPPGGRVMTDPDYVIRLRFSHPLDPRTVNGQSVFLEIVSVPGRALIPISTLLRQTTLGTVEVVVTPEQPLPMSEFMELVIASKLRDLAGNVADPFILPFTSPAIRRLPEEVDETFDTNAREDAEATTASWNGTKAGALVSAPADSTARSLWYDATIPMPNYHAAEADLDAYGGTIEIFVQGAREDVTRPGPQPVDPETDSERVSTTDWVPLDEADKIDSFQYLRFRVEFTLPPGYIEGDPLPVLRRIQIPSIGSRD